MEQPSWKRAKKSKSVWCEKDAWNWSCICRKLCPKWWWGPGFDRLIGAWPAAGHDHGGRMVCWEEEQRQRSLPAVGWHQHPQTRTCCQEIWEAFGESYGKLYSQIKPMQVIFGDIIMNWIAMRLKLLPMLCISYLQPLLHKSAILCTTLKGLISILSKFL